MTPARPITGEYPLERPGARLRWVEWAPEGDAAEPAVFLLHGLSSNALFWARLAAHFPHRRLVALDQRGHGGAERATSGYTTGELAADAAAAIEAAGLRRPVVAGHSWGASAALELAATRPDLVGGMAIIDGPVIPMSERMSWTDAAQLMQPPIARHPELEDAYRRQAQYLEGAWAGDLEEFVRTGHFRDGDAWVMTLSADAREQALRGLYEFQPQLAWALIRVPVLLALASADEAMRAWKQAGAEAVAQAQPSADIRWYASRHDIPLILPDEVAADLERLCLRAGFADVPHLAARLTGDFTKPATPAEDGPGGWTALEVLAHVVSTQSAMAAVLAAPPSPAGTEQRPFDPDRWNRSQLARRAAATFLQLLEELEAGVHTTDAALREADLAANVNAGPYAGLTVADAMRHMVVHQHGHLAQIQAAIAT